MTNRLACVIAALLLNPLTATAQATERAPRICPTVSPANGIGGTGIVAKAQEGLGGTGITADKQTGIGGTGIVAQAQEGLGGTGLTTDKQTGVGGTGIVAQAQEGLGGTGITPDKQSGIGGTGIVAEAQQGFGGSGMTAQNSSGIGGTGSPARRGDEDGDGIGGTGVTRIAANLVGAVGKVMATDRDNHVFMLAKGSEVCPGDRIETAANSAAKLEFTDGAVLLLRATTRLSLDQYAWREEQPEESSFQVSLLEGGIRSVSGKLSKSHPEAFQLSTPNSVIGVLGTDYQVVHLNEPNEELEPGTYASVASGEIRMSNDHGVIQLKAGEAAAAIGKEAPTRLKLWPNCLVCR